MFDLPPVNNEKNFTFDKPSSAIETVCKVKNSLISYFLPSTVPIAKIIKKPKTECDLTYAQLPLESIDIANINELIHTIAENGKIELFLKHEKHLRAIGADLEARVHSFKFLSVIFKDSILKADIKKIRHDYFKWKNFIDGLSNRMTILSLKGKIDKYVNDFAVDINMPADQILPFCKKRDWKGLVIFLIHHT